ncbi:hypothetical protein DES52_103182 [Deinococcus yavapaiensis KR-236]|uniref:Uncharacterized protein n=1 Tax=Deinococcus yavapaiensis KR-236 TaxID=694435 RepID=A0A318SLF3_9DEIO|nr:hypothetical protein DES52_103182 [Deinococcus yavapaiensis KR-236]
MNTPESTVQFAQERLATLRAEASVRRLTARPRFT